MTARYIHHVTLTTGHVRRSPRHEVGDDVVAMLGRWIESALAGEEVPMRGYGTVITAQRRGKCLIVDVMDDTPARTLLATIGVAAHSKCGSALWRDLHAEARALLVTDPEHPPAEPWVAARLHSGLLLGGHEALGWLGDFERCIAWAWIEK